MNLQEIKHEFFAYRNGVVADTLRRSGMNYRMIFGCDVPSIAAIARRIGYDDVLAEQLWSEADVRESRLLATYLFDPAKTEIDKAVRLASEVRTREEADMLAFRLLKRLPYATELAEKLSALQECALAFQSLSHHLS